MLKKQPPLEIAFMGLQANEGYKRGLLPVFKYFALILLEQEPVFLFLPYFSFYLWKGVNLNITDQATDRNLAAEILLKNFLALPVA